FDPCLGPSGPVFFASRLATSRPCGNRASAFRASPRGRRERQPRAAPVRDYPAVTATAAEAAPQPAAAAAAAPATAAAAAPAPATAAGSGDASICLGIRSGPSSTLNPQPSSETRGDKNFWMHIGAAFENQDGSWNLRFDFLPTDAGTTIQLRD